MSFFSNIISTFKANMAPYWNYNCYCSYGDYGPLPFIFHDFVFGNIDIFKRVGYSTKVLCYKGVMDYLADFKKYTAGIGIFFESSFPTMPWISQPKMFIFERLEESILPAGFIIDCNISNNIIDFVDINFFIHYLDNITTGLTKYHIFHKIDVYFKSGLLKAIKRNRIQL
jgi:hypothetical protein